MHNSATPTMCKQPVMSTPRRITPPPKIRGASPGASIARLSSESNTRRSDARKTETHVLNPLEVYQPPFRIS